MKQILLMRHGKSSWDYKVSDQNRPLKKRGMKDAEKVGKKFKTLAISIDAAYGSPANRAFQTGMIFLSEAGFALENLRIQESLYDFSGECVEDFVKEMDDARNTVILFGHNHAFTLLANQWGDRYIENVPTAGLVHIAFDVQNWAAITKGITKHILFPKNLTL